MLKKRLKIIYVIKKRNARYLKNTHKFGIEVNKSVARAYALDENNGNTLWVDVIANYMKDVSPAFRKLDIGEIVPIGYQCLNCRILFDVKMEYFHRKARLVAVGHVTEPQSNITYASVVSRETVSNSLKLASLNNFPVKVADIQNAYITAPFVEKIWKVLGPDFGEDAGRKAILVRAIYGLKSSGS